MKNTIDELRRAVRTLLRNRGFALISVFTLAVGIAANTAIFSVVYGVVLKPLPYPEAERLVIVGHSAPGVNLPDLDQAAGTHRVYLEHNEAFEYLAAVEQGSQTLSGSGEPEKLQSAKVSPQFAGVFRVPPSMGRPITEGDALPGASQVVLLSHGLWNRRFGGSPDVIGRSIDIGSVPHEVVGVMPPGFTFPGEGTDIWLPLRLDREDFGGFFLTGVGRLKSGYSVEQANASLQRLIPRVAEFYPNFPAGFFENLQLRANVSSLKEEMVGDIQNTLWILFGAVGIVLLVACANVANLFLLRAEARRREVAVRVALGADRSAVVRYFLSESATLAGLGGLVGVFLAWVGIRALVGLAPGEIPRLAEVEINGQVLAFSVALSVLSGLFFGSFPIIRHAGPDVAEFLKEGGRNAGAGRKRHRVRHSLVVAQIAFTLVLLIGSGLMLRSIRELHTVDTGLDAESVLTFRLSIPDAEYSDQLRSVRFHEELERRIEALPGVEEVGYANALPLSGNGFGRNPLLSEDNPLGADEVPPSVYMNPVGPDFFSAMRIPLLAGRVLEPSDARDRTGAVVVSTALASQFWPNESPLGKRVHPGTNEDPVWYTVVGVVGDVHVNSLRGEVSRVLYLPTIGNSDAAWWTPLTMEYAVRTNVPPLSLAAAVREVVWGMDPNLPIAQMRTMERVIAETTVQTSFAMLLIAIAAAVALALGTVGIYAVIAYVVGQRTGEIGMRIAMGARSHDITRLILTQGGMVALIGVAIGTVGAFGLTRLLGAMLFEVSPTDPSTYASMSVLLLAVALLASYLPARRAATIDPLEALRTE